MYYENSDLLNGEVVDFKPKLLVLMGPFCHGDAVLELEDGETLHVDSGKVCLGDISVLHNQISNLYYMCT